MKRGFLLAAALCVLTGTAAAARVVPALQTESREAAGTQTAILAGGCFWGLEGVFQHVKGVTDVVSGYAGGDRKTANYNDVSSERTGHAEAVRISYDPKQISYGDLLRIYFSVTTDPTQLNRQGPDTGPSYRSAIFPQNAAQRAAAQAYIAQLAAAHTFKRPIVTKIESGAFYPAEAYHQDFMRKNPLHPYILMHDRPKVAALKKLFPTKYKG